MAYIAMQNGPYRNAIQAILQNHPLFLAEQGGKNRPEISISMEIEVLNSGDRRRETDNSPAELRMKS